MTSYEMEKKQISKDKSNNKTLPPKRGPACWYDLGFAPHDISYIEFDQMGGLSLRLDSKRIVRWLKKSGMFLLNKVMAQSCKKISYN